MSQKISRTILKNKSFSEETKANNEIDAKTKRCGSAKKLQFDEKSLIYITPDVGTPHGSPQIDDPMSSHTRMNANFSASESINPNDLRKRLLQLKQEEAEILSGKSAAMLKQHSTNVNIKQIVDKLKQRSMNSDDSDEIDELTTYESFEDKRRRFHKNEFIITKKQREEMEELGPITTTDCETANSIDLECDLKD